MKSIFFVEEKAIFQISDKVIGEEVSEIFDLMKEHGEILEILRTIEGEIEEGEKPNITKLKFKLIKHAKFEDKMFYPKLDELLSEDQKKEIIKRVKEVVHS